MSSATEHIKQEHEPLLPIITLYESRPSVKIEQDHPGEVSVKHESDPGSELLLTQQDAMPEGHLSRAQRRALAKQDAKKNKKLRIRQQQALTRNDGRTYPQMNEPNPSKKAARKAKRQRRKQASKMANPYKAAIAQSNPQESLVERLADILGGATEISHCDTTEPQSLQSKDQTVAFDVLVAKPEKEVRCPWCRTRIANILPSAKYFGSPCQTLPTGTVLQYCGEKHREMHKAMHHVFCTVLSSGICTAKWPQNTTALRLAPLMQDNHGPNEYRARQLVFYCDERYSNVYCLFRFRDRTDRTPRILTSHGVRTSTEPPADLIRVMLGLAFLDQTFRKLLMVLYCFIHRRLRQVWLREKVSAVQSSHEFQSFDHQFRAEFEIDDSPSVEELETPWENLWRKFMTAPGVATRIKHLAKVGRGRGMWY